MSRWKSALLAAAAVTIVVGALRVAGVFEPFERKTLDARMRLLKNRADFRGDIVFVSIGQTSLNFFSRSEQKIGWPWPRDLWAYLIDYCREGGAKLIVFDIGFTEPSRTGADEDRELARAMEDFGRVIQATPFTDDPTEDTGVPAEFVDRNALPVEGPAAASDVKAIVNQIDPVWKAARRVAAARTYPDPDGANRSYPTLLSYGGRYYLSMGLAAAVEIAGAKSARAEAGALVLGDKPIPVDSRGQMLLLYGASDREVVRYEAAEVITSASLRLQGKAHKYDPDIFKDKIVFLGAWAPGLLDLKVTPLDEAHPAVMVHATALSNILNGRFLRRLPTWVSLAALALVVIATCFATRFASPLVGALSAVLMIALCLGAAALAFKALLWIDVLSPAVGVALSFGAVSAVNHLYEGRRRREVKKIFQRYVSPAVVDKILKRTNAVAMGGERKELTILFLDFQGFTEMSERLGPAELVKLIDEYHSEAVEEVFRQDGTLDKYIGDAIMAYWNDPLPLPDHAARACLAAAGIRERLKRLAAKMREAGMPEMRARIGINTGPAIVGDMGSKLQPNYTAMGDSVNLASRLEGVNKEFGTDIIVSESTLAGARDRIETRELALIAVKGKRLPVRIFEVLGRRGEAPAEVIAAARRFEEGLAAFRARRWPDAAKLFDGPGRADAVYAALCARYAADAPGDDWEGVYVMEHK